MTDTTTATPWHHMSAAAVLEQLGTSDDGLSDSEAAARLAKYGSNELPQAAGRGALRRFMAQFHNVLIYLLLVAAAVALVLGHVVDAGVIVAVVAVNAVVGFVQEGRAEKALAAMRSLIAPEALVVRDGHRRKVPVRDLVRGDVVVLEAGDRVPADLRLLRTRRMLVDEALLTGESLAAEKNDAAAAIDAALGDRPCMAFSGTLIAAGQGTGLVVETGIHSQIGRISALIQSVEPLSTPLLRQIDAFAKRFTWLVLIGGALLFTFAVGVRGFGWTEALIAVVALAVGIVPEGLPAVLTITLAIGVRRMAARKAVIRSLPAVETLGATSVICTDKTGTLTRNEMTARRVVTNRYELLATGSGYAPAGALKTASSDDVAALEAASGILRCGVLCNDAELS
ncbi:MAG TPA: HAD-IC family P-type ATPase, partial [Dongiaceae bacterium]